MFRVSPKTIVSTLLAMVLLAVVVQAVRVHDPVQRTVGLNTAGATPSTDLPIAKNATASRDIYLYNWDEKGINDLEEVKDRLDKGIPVAIYGQDIDMVKLYPFFQENKLPFSMERGKDEQAVEEYSNMADQEDLAKIDKVEPPDMASEASANSKQDEYISITPLIILLPKGDYTFVSIEDMLSWSKDKDKLEQEVKTCLKTIDITFLVNDYEDYIDKIVLSRAAVAAESSDARLLTSIRQTHTFYGDFYFAGYTHYGKKAGKHITDYLIYDAGDSDPSYDHLIIEGDVRVFTFPYLNDSVPPYVTRGFLTKLDNYYASDTLIDWAPDTGGLNLDNGSSYTCVVGYPWSVSIEHTWGGESSTHMEGIGNKENQSYYNYFYKDGNGLSLTPFTVEYSAMYKSAGTWLKLYYQNLFGVALGGTPPGYTWYGNTWYVLTYD